jgi:hypothetical protein
MNLWYDDIGFAKKMVALLKLKLARLLEKMRYRRECLVQLKAIPLTIDMPRPCVIPPVIGPLIDFGADVTQQVIRLAQALGNHDLKHLDLIAARDVSDSDVTMHREHGDEA